MDESQPVGETAVIKGRNVGLRQVEPRDLEFLAALANDPEVSSLVTGWSFPVNEDEQCRWFEDASSSRDTRRLMVVGAGDSPVGMTGLWQINWHDRNALTAVKLYPPSVRASGIGTDSIMTLMAYAFHGVGLERLWSSIIDFNGASFGAYVKNCGWRIEGVLRREVLRKGSYHDVFRIAILRDEFDALPAAKEYVDRVVPVDVTDKVEPLSEWWA